MSATGATRLDCDNVAEWARRAARRVERLRGQGRPDDLLEAEALHDLFRRGLDPDQPRRFRGRVELTVYCATPRRHTLARVYPTAVGPSVLVPSVAVPRPGAQSSPAPGRELRRIFGANAPDVRRDPWIVIPGDQSDPRSAVAGLTVLTPDRRHLVDTTEQGSDTGWRLRCRCGGRDLFAAVLLAALHENASAVHV